MQEQNHLAETILGLDAEQENFSATADTGIQASHFQDNAAAAESKDAQEQDRIQKIIAQNSKDGRLILGPKLLNHIDIPLLANALNTDTTGERLYICEVPLNEASTKAIADVIQHNTNLKEIVLAKNNLGCEGAATLAAALKKNATLQELMLYENDIRDAGATALAAMLKTNTTLKLLVLDKNPIHEPGLAAIAEALKINTALESITFSTAKRDMTPEEQKIVQDIQNTFCANAKSRGKHRESYHNALPGKIVEATAIPVGVAGIIQDYVSREEYPPRDSAPPLAAAAVPPVDPPAAAAADNGVQASTQENAEEKERYDQKECMLNETTAAIRNTFDHLKAHIEAVINLMEENPLYKLSSNKLKTVRMLQDTLNTHIRLPEDNAALIDKLPRYQFLLIRSIALASIIIGYNTKGGRAAQFGQFFKAPKEANEIRLFNTWLQFQDPSLTPDIEVVTANLRAALAASIREAYVLDAQKPFKSLLERIQERTAQGGDGAFVLLELIRFRSKVEQNLPARALS